MIGKNVVSPESIRGHAVRDTISVWHHANIEDNVEIGAGSVVGSSVYIGTGAILGNDVHVQHGAFICRRAVVEDGVFIGPGAKLLDDTRPRAGLPYLSHPPILKTGCSVGAGAIIMPEVIVGSLAMVGAGAVVTKNVPDSSIVCGVPAVQQKTLTESLHVNQVDKKDDSNQHQDSNGTLVHVHKVIISLEERKE